MGTIIQPNMLKSAVAAKLAAAAAQVLELREAEQPRLTPHLSSPEILGTFLHHVRGVYPIIDAFGKVQAGELVYKAWHETWRSSLPKADLVLWDRLRDDGKHEKHTHGAELIEDEISVTATHGNLPKLRVRFASDPNRAASEVCSDYLRLARRFADDFMRDHERFLT